VHITTFCPPIQVRFDAARLRANDMIKGLVDGWIEKIMLERYMKQKPLEPWTKDTTLKFLPPVTSEAEDLQRTMNAHINGIEVHYIDAGNSNALPVVLIHGFPFSNEMWEPQIKILENNFRVIAYDVRGHGKSDVGDGQYTLEFLVDDLIGLLDYLKIQKAILCGLSMGGYIALRTIERNPERVLGLVLADTQSKADTNEAKFKRADSIRSVKTIGVQAFAEVSVKSVFAPQSFTSNVEAIENIRRIIQANSPIGICGALLAMAGRTDTTDALAGIKVPTLILVGEHDGLLYQLASQEMRDRIPNSELHIISNAGHMSNLENPEEFNTHLLNFLGKLANRS